MGLLIENGSRPKLSPQLKWVLISTVVFFVLLVVLIFLAHYYFVYQKNLVKVVNAPKEVEKTQATLDTLYSTEANPLPFTVPDSLNYGLTSKDTGANIKGSILLSAEPIAGNYIEEWQ